MVALSGLAEICRLYVSMTLMTAAGGKIIWFSRFELSTAVWLKMPQRLSKLVALGVVVCEATAAILLLFPGSVIAGEWLALLMFASFFVLSVITLIKGESIGCNCFGQNGQRLNKFHLAVQLVAISATSLSIIPACISNPFTLFEDMIAAVLAFNFMIIFLNFESLVSTLADPW